MPPLIPAICKSCGMVWFGEHHIVVKAERLTLRNVRMAPCPNCGGTGDVPDGVYGTASAVLHDLKQYSVVMNAMENIQAMVSRGATKEEVEKEISQKYPFLAYLKNLLAPKDWKEVAIIIGLAISVWKHYAAGEGPKA